jgi:hypothetical protein
LVVELVDTQDLKSCLQQCGCGFNSRPGHTDFSRFLGIGFFVWSNILAPNSPSLFLKHYRKTLIFLPCGQTIALNAINWGAFMSAFKENMAFGMNTKQEAARNLDKIRRKYGNKRIKNMNINQLELLRGRKLLPLDKIKISF